MFIARQPVFNRSLDVFGYELLFRSNSQSNQFEGSSSSMATATVLTGLFESGIHRIVDDKCAFVNFDGEFIHSNSLELIDSSSLVIEVLEDVKVDEALIERLKNLKKKGYKIALDDFVESYNEYPLIPIADIIKFDIIATPLDTIALDVKQAISQKKILLAEKIEREEDFLKAKCMGFNLFQGYFFSKPSIIGKSCSKTTSKAQYARLILELKKEEPSYQVLAEIIQQDVNIAYRLMRVVSIRSGDDLINSIKRALTYMGLREIERWINILMIQDFAGSKPKELMRTSLIRTKLAESIASQGNLKKIKHEASMMGLFSTLDAMLDQTMAEALADISLPSSITDALIHHQGVLHPVYDLMLAYEKGNWEKTKVIAKKMGIKEYILLNDYLLALEWAKEIFDVIYPN